MVRRELAEQMEEFRTVFRQLKEDIDRHDHVQGSKDLDQEIVDRVHRLEEELKRRGKILAGAAK